MFNDYISLGLYI